MRFSTRLMLTGMAGAAVALGQVPWSLWPLALIGLATLLFLVANETLPLRAGLLALAAGTAHFALAMNWIVEPFLIEPERYGWMAPFALMFMAVGGGLFWALPVWAFRRAHFDSLAGLVLALTLSDLARGYVLTGFPWVLFGHIWIETPVAQIAAMLGQTGLSLLSLTLAACLAALPAKKSLAAAFVLVLALSWGFGLWRLAQPEPTPPGITLRLVQPNAAQAAKWDPNLARQHFDALLAATAAAPPVDLVIWPETSLPYSIENSPEVPGMIAAASGGAHVMLGLQRVEGNRGWNSLRVQDATGGQVAVYDKHHLVPFGEYIPFGEVMYDWFGITAFAAQLGKVYSAGEGAKVLDLGVLGKVLPLICYEAVFPQDLRAAPERASWIAQITNDAWFGQHSGPFQHASLAGLRAIEQGLPLARVANTGVTGMFDAKGRLTESLTFGTKGHLDVAVPGLLPATPFARWGEGPLVVLLGGLAAWLFRRRSSPSA